MFMATATTQKYIQSRKRTKAPLPKVPFNNIAISLSGGGFRATGYHMGVVTYLSTLNIYGTSLLERSRILCTASAGTFVGVKYVTNLKRGGSMESFYRQLYRFISKKDTVEDALEYLSNDENWKDGKNRTLINAFAAIYYKYFEQDTFGLLWDENIPIHLKEISFNATEFNFGMPFRFRKTENQNAVEYNFIGNNKIQVPIRAVKDVRLADIIAASSCFPFGFEPINFPDDFIHDKDSKLNDPSQLPYHVYDGDIIEYPIGLMDGGIDDNQGVDAVVMAEERMKNYRGEAEKFRSNDKKAVDLFIISDASIPKMESYSKGPKAKKSTIGLLNFKKLRTFGILSAVLGSIIFMLAWYAQKKFFIISFSTLGTVGMIIALVLLIFSLGFSGFTKLLGVPEFFSKRLAQFDKIRFQLLYSLIAERRKSAMKLVSKVFVKQMRWYSYQRVYGETEWRPRLMLNAILDMTYDEVEKRQSKYPYFTKEIREPGQAMIRVAHKANSMNTTLWFTEKELQGKDNMVNSVIACGQFTMCYNLIEYLEKFILNHKYASDYEKYSPEIQKAVTDLHDKLLRDWAKFKEDPYWMVNEWNNRLNLGNH